MKNINIRWLIRVIVGSFVLTTGFVLISNAVLSEAGYILAFCALFVFVVIGTLFDLVGVAVTAADETPFHSMAAHRGRGAKEAIRLIKNADRVANFCSDVVGNITGLVCGTTTAAIAVRLANDFLLSDLVTQLVISGIVVGLMIGGNAWGKSVAISNSTAIVLFVARLIHRKNWIWAKLRRKA